MELIKFKNNLECHILNVCGEKTISDSSNITYGWFNDFYRCPINRCLDVEYTLLENFKKICGRTLLSTWFIDDESFIKIYRYGNIPKKLLQFIESHLDKKIGNKSLVFFTKETEEWTPSFLRFCPFTYRILKQNKK